VLDSDRRARDPIIKVHDIAWSEFEKPDLTRAETFSRAFGLHGCAHDRRPLLAWHRCRVNLHADPARSPVKIRRSRIRGRRSRGPVMSFIRCDRGQTPADHHTLAIALGPSNRYIHSAYQVSDINAMGAGVHYLAELGYHRSRGIGRHIQGSQIFDYWRDPDGFLVEYDSDSDMFDSTVEPGWAPFTASGLSQWGPPITKDFLGIAPGRESLRELRSVISALT
jgi:hypothetical protein